MRQYYASVFPAGEKPAQTAIKAAIVLLQDNPLAGRPSDKIDGLRELAIRRTPFTFIYRVTADCVDIIRIKDQRSVAS